MSLIHEMMRFGKFVGGGTAESVLYTEQGLTKEQQEQARANIGAASVDAVFSLSSEQTNALDALFKAASYIKDVSAEYAAFCDAFGLVNPDVPGESNPQWIIGLAYSNGGRLGVYSTARAVYVSEIGDQELEYDSTSVPRPEKKYYPMELGNSNSVIVTCPTSMRPAVAALALSNGSWNEVGVSGWMPEGGGKYSIPSGATHYFCAIRKTNESALAQADFENVVVSLSMS